MISENEVGKTPYKRLLIKNGHGRCVQVTAWRENKDKLANIEQLNVVVYLKALLATYPKLPIYNHGNINLEFLMKNNSEVEIWGIYVNPKDEELLPTEIEIHEVPNYVNRHVGKKIFLFTYALIHK